MSEKYLKEYREEGDIVFFTLKDYPSSRLNGNKIVKEIFLNFYDIPINLNEVQETEDPYTFFVSKTKSYCVNCKFPITFDEHFIAHCENCRWINSDEPPADCDPVMIIKEKDQIAFSPINKSDLTHLPEKLKESVINFLKNTNFDNLSYQNIYHNLYKKNSKKFKILAKRYSQKAKLSDFFKKTNFIK